MPEQVQTIQDKDVEKYKERIEKFVSELLLSYKPRNVKDRKVIHEAIHGSNIFFEHEIAILDSPLLQRLRKIHQNGLAYLTYPTAVHTRFDHTLGVVSVIDGYVDAINANLGNDQKELQIKKDPYVGDYAELRMAALLHDCGHSFFSHTSERLYEDHSILKSLIKDNSDLKNRQPHEMHSYYIVKSETFKKWFEENIKNIRIDLDTVANMIIGVHEDPDKKYLAEMINGHLDADKLDYIRRDSFFSGLKLICDSERLFKTLRIRGVSKFGIKKNHIVLNTFLPVEQIIVSRRTLFVSVYHHQKVRACESMVHSLAEYMKETNYKKITLKHPVDYLYYNDWEFMKILGQENDPFIKDIISSIMNRNLYMRAFSICKSTVKDGGSIKYYLNDLTHNSKYRKKIQEEIWDNIPSNIRNKYRVFKSNIQLSFPKIPDPQKDETLRARVIDRATHKLIELNKYVPVNEWLNGFFNHKYRGYVFCPHFEELREHVFNASKKVFQQTVKIDINEDYCKNDIHLYC